MLLSSKWLSLSVMGKSVPGKGESCKEENLINSTCTCHVPACKPHSVEAVRNRQNIKRHKLKIFMIQSAVKYCSKYIT